MERSFERKVVIVTGGALGMGAATAVAFAQAGANVVVADLNGEAGRAMEDNGILFVHADVASDSDCRRVVAAAREVFGGVDILFNNVGIQPLDSYRTVADLPEELWDRILGVNLKSYFLMAKYAIPEMRKRGGGVIINNASVQGLASMERVSAYAASKGGALALTRAMALDHARENIRVLAICPGTIDTAMVRTAAQHESARTGEAIEEVLARYGAAHPIGRIGTGEDIARVVLFLASEGAAFMTGSHVCVDGGFMARGSWALTVGAR